MNSNEFNGGEGGEDFNKLMEIAAGGGQEPIVEQIPERFGDVAFDTFNKALVEATGGAVQDFNSLKEVIAAKGRLSEMEQSFNTLKQQEEAFRGGPKYANELVEKIDKMFKDGATEDSIQEFIKLQRMNVSEMDDESVLKTLYKKEFPQFTDDELDEMLKEEFDGSSLKLKKAAIEGRKKLEEMKVNIQEPENIRMQKIQGEQAKARFENWVKVNAAVWGKKESHSFDLQIGDASTKLNFALPIDTREHITLEVSKYAAQNKIPATQEGLKHLQDVAERMLFFKHGKEILSTLFRDVSAKTKEEILSAMHNVSSQDRGDGGNKGPVTKKLSPAEEQRARILKEGMNGSWR
jgi:hypothetical protein